MLLKSIIHRMAAAALELQSLLRFVKFGIHKKKIIHKQHKSETKALLMFKFYSEIQPQGTNIEE